MNDLLQPKAAIARQRESGFLETGGGAVVWSAVSPLQLALEDREAEEPQGVFTRRFVQGIAERRADRNGDGRVVNAELLDWLRSESAAYCRRHPRDCEAGLTPSLEGPRNLLMLDAATGKPVGGTTEAAEGALGHDNEAGVALENPSVSRLRFATAWTYRSERPAGTADLDVADDGTSRNSTRKVSERRAPRSLAGAGSRSERYYGFALEAGPPAGRGKLFARVTEDPVSLDDFTGRTGFRPVRSGMARALGKRLEARSGRGRDPRGCWSRRSLTTRSSHDAQRRAGGRHGKPRGGCLEKNAVPHRCALLFATRAGCSERRRIPRRRSAGPAGAGNARVPTAAPPSPPCDRLLGEASGAGRRNAVLSPIGIEAVLAWRLRVRIAHATCGSAVPKASAALRRMDARLHDWRRSGLPPRTMQELSSHGERRLRRPQLEVFAAFRPP